MKSLNILIIDDNRSFLNSAINFLNAVSNFASLSWATNLAEAEDRMQLYKPDLVLLDFRFKELSGLELSARIKEIYPGTMVIALSFIDDLEYRNHTRLAGIDGLVDKSEFTVQILPMINEIFQPVK